MRLTPTRISKLESANSEQELKYYPNNIDRQLKLYCEENPSIKNDIYYLLVVLNENKWKDLNIDFNGDFVSRFEKKDVYDYMDSFVVKMKAFIKEKNPKMVVTSEQIESMSRNKDYRKYACIRVFIEAIDIYLYLKSSNPEYSPSQFKKEWYMEDLFK